MWNDTYLYADTGDRQQYLGQSVTQICLLHLIVCLGWSSQFFPNLLTAPYCLFRWLPQFFRKDMDRNKNYGITESAHTWSFKTASTLQSLYLMRRQNIYFPQNRPPLSSHEQQTPKVLLSTPCQFVLDGCFTITHVCSLCDAWPLCWFVYIPRPFRSLCSEFCPQDHCYPVW